MAKQILLGIREQDLNEVAHYLMIYLPYNEELCSYTDNWLGELYENSGTYFLLDKDKKVICKIDDYVPNGLIPEVDDCGDYIRLRINYDGTIENWPEEPDFSDFIEGAGIVEKIDTSIEEEPIFDTKVEFTYSQLMTKLLRLPKYLQMEIGKALIANASEGFEEEEE